MLQGFVFSFLLFFYRFFQKTVPLNGQTAYSVLMFPLAVQKSYTKTLSYRSHMRFQRTLIGVVLKEGMEKYKELESHLPAFVCLLNVERWGEEALCVLFSVCLPPCSPLDPPTHLILISLPRCSHHPLVNSPLYSVSCLPFPD